MLHEGVQEWHVSTDKKCLEFWYDVFSREMGSYGFQMINGRILSNSMLWDILKQVNQSHMLPFSLVVIIP